MKRSDYVVFPLLACFTCARPAEVVPDLRPVVQKLNQRLAEQAEALASLEENLIYSLCSEEMALFLHDVRKDCDDVMTGKPKAPGALKTTAAAPQPADRSEPCRAKQVENAVFQDEQTYRTRFATLLVKSQHAVAYLGERSASSGQGQDEFPLRRRKREERIAKLAGIPNLRDSRFLVVASPEKPNAEGRLRWMRTFLLEHGVTPERLDRPLLYDLRLPPGDIQPADKPVPPSETDLSSAVWVFRTSCPAAPYP